MTNRKVLVQKAGLVALVNLSKVREGIVEHWASSGLTLLNLNLGPVFIEHVLIRNAFNPKNYTPEHTNVPIGLLLRSGEELDVFTHEFVQRAYDISSSTHVTAPFEPRYSYEGFTNGGPAELRVSFRQADGPEELQMIFVNLQNKEGEILLHMAASDVKS